MLLIDQDFLPQAIALLNTAKSYINIATFKAEISPKPRGRALRLFYETLFAKRKSGVVVNFFLNWNSQHRSVPTCNMATLLELKKQKINVYTLPNNRCCHAKIIIADRAQAIIGSHNLSIASCHRNFEASYLITDKVSVDRLCFIFTRTCSNATSL